MKHGNNSPNINLDLKKLVFISLTNSAGGAENVLLMMANINNSPLIFLKQVFSAGLHFNKNQKVQYLNKKSIFIGFIFLLARLFHYRRGYIIVSSHPYLNAYLGFLKRVGFLKSVLVARECTSIFTRYKGLKKLSYQIAYKLGYNSHSLIICQTDVMRNQLLEHNKFISPNKVVILENPIDIEHVKKGAVEFISDDDLKSSFICAAGRLIPEKGFSILIKAFADIAPEHKNLRLIILGDGPEKNNLLQIIKQLSLLDRVILKGHVNNPFPYFKQAKLCVVSSIQEGFPNVLLQMMAVNKCVLSTLCAGGIEEITTIIKTEVNNVNALRLAISSALDESCKFEQGNDYFKNRTPDIFLNTVLKNIG